MTFFKFFSLKLLDFDQPFFVLFILFGRTRMYPYIIGTGRIDRAAGAGQLTAENLAHASRRIHRREK